MNRYKMVNNRTDEVRVFTRPYLTGREIKWATQMVHDYMDRTLKEDIEIDIYRNDKRIATVFGIILDTSFGYIVSTNIVDYTKIHSLEDIYSGKKVYRSHLSTGKGIETLTCMEEAWR